MKSCNRDQKITICPAGDSSKGGGFSRAVRRLRKQAKLKDKRPKPCTLDREFSRMFGPAKGK